MKLNEEICYFRYGTLVIIDSGFYLGVSGKVINRDLTIGTYELYTNDGTFIEVSCQIVKKDILVQE